MNDLSKVFRLNRQWLSLVSLAVLAFLITGCGLTTGTPQSGALQREETVILPTRAPTVAASPVNTRVMPVEVLTPAPSPTITPLPDETLVLVVDVMDGKTVSVVLNGDPAGRVYQVRYIGIDTPPNSSTDPWGVVAFETNKKLTNLKVVRLVRDKTDFDTDGHLLRHVYVDNQLISQRLVELGLARVDYQEPNLGFETDLKAIEVSARDKHLGIWGSEAPTPTPGRVISGTVIIPTPTLAVTPTLTPEITSTPGTGGAQEEATPEAEVTATNPAEAITVTPTASRTATATRTPEPTEAATPENP